LDYARRERLSRGLIRLAAKRHAAFYFCDNYGATLQFLWSESAPIGRESTTAYSKGARDATYKNPVFPIASNSKINRSADHPFQSPALACFSFKSQLAPIEARDSSRIEIPTLFPNFRISDAAPRRGEAGSDAIIVAEIYGRD